MDVLARIVARYGAGFLVAWGVLDPTLGKMIEADPDILAWIQIGLGATAFVVAEGWYYLAKKLGWRT